MSGTRIFLRHSGQKTLLPSVTDSTMLDHARRLSTVIQLSTAYLLLQQRFHPFLFGLLGVVRRRVRILFSRMLLLRMVRFSHLERSSIRRPFSCYAREAPSKASAVPLGKSDQKKNN